MLQKIHETSVTKISVGFGLGTQDDAFMTRRPVKVDKIASVAGRASVTENLWVTLATRKPRPGDLVVAKVKTDSSTYNRLELTTGRMARLNPGDVIVGAIGARRALRGYVGEVPEELAIGDDFHLLNMGGVMGRCTGFHHEMGPPMRLEYLGSVVRDGRVLNMADFALETVPYTPGSIPVVAVAGSCMHAGKTRAASELIRRFTEAGSRVAAGKLSGVACLKDSLEMRDNGAVHTLSFVDLGLPSTVGLDDLGWVARNIIGHLASTDVDVIVVELGDGILGGYNVASILDDEIVRQSLAAMVFCASDFVGAWGGVELLKQRGLMPDVIAGSVTDSRMGVDFIRQKLGLAAANAMVGGASLYAIVESRLSAWRQQWFKA
jgi:hypothetical protein